jgi:hypothetical protein
LLPYWGALHFGGGLVWILVKLLMSAKESLALEVLERLASKQQNQAGFNADCRMFSLIVAVAIASGLALLPAWQVKAQDFGLLNGTWEGNLRPVNGAGLVASDKPLPIRMIVRDDSAQVFTGESFEVEAKPRKFKVERTGTNMIVFAIDSGEDKDGIWVETWAFVITQKDRDTLIANFYRVVNNTEMPVNAHDSKFSMAKTGEFKRVSQ